MLPRFDKTGKLHGMTATPHRADHLPQPIEDVPIEPVSGEQAQPNYEEAEADWVSPEVAPQPAGAGGRMVLGWALAVLAAAWIA
jgi:hypothetical protein